MARSRANTCLVQAGRPPFNSLVPEKFELPACLWRHRSVKRTATGNVKKFLENFSKKSDQAAQSWMLMRREGLKNRRTTASQLSRGKRMVGWNPNAAKLKKNRTVEHWNGLKIWVWSSNSGLQSLKCALRFIQNKINHLASRKDRLKWKCLSPEISFGASELNVKPKDKNSLAY